MTLHLPLWFFNWNVIEVLTKNIPHTYFYPIFALMTQYDQMDFRNFYTKILIIGAGRYSIFIQFVKSVNWYEENLLCIEYHLKFQHFWSKKGFFWLCERVLHSHSAHKKKKKPFPHKKKREIAFLSRFPRKKNIHHSFTRAKKLLHSVSASSRWNLHFAYYSSKMYRICTRLVDIYRSV